MMYLTATMPSTDPPSPGEYTIDELAAAARIPSRTIRFYQSRGALMAPEIRGRVAYYKAAHVERLKLIAQLQDRGLRMDAIRDLVASIERGETDLAQWLGVEQQVQTPWANDKARFVTEEELRQITGSTRPGLVAELLRAGLLERRDGDQYLLTSPALLSIGTRLEAAGVDLVIAQEASRILQKHVERAVRELIELFVKRAQEGLVRIDEPAKLLEELRPVGLDAVRVIFGRSMEQGLRKLFESGALATIPKYAKKAELKRKGR
jgi:DNA-binding transcriptional MerR regulator